MGGITMWVILGSLVGVVATFLIVASVLDRRKVKKQKVKKAEHDKKIDLSKGEVYLWLSILIKFNNATLKNFVPSVGKLKMSDIRNKAKESLEMLTKDVSYKLAIDGEDGEAIEQLVDKFLHTNSNTWTKKLDKEINDLKAFIKKLAKSDYEEFVKKTQTKLQGIYQ